RKVAVVGVGAGALAAYAKKGWELTLFEADPAVVRAARDPASFTYLADAEARGAAVTVKPGDGRLQLDQEADASFDLIVLDAFGSDAPPIHLLTREAFEIYKKKLKPDGLLAVNLTSRRLELAGVVGKLAEATALAALVQQ